MPGNSVLWTLRTAAVSYHARKRRAYDAGRSRIRQGPEPRHILFQPLMRRLSHELPHGQWPILSGQLACTV